MQQRHYHWTFVWVPIAGAIVWFGTLLAMLVTWLAEGRPKYVSQDSKVAYISDVGADRLKPLFIAGSTVTALSFFVSLVIERWLRHSGRLRPNMRKRERVLSSLSILGAFIGGAALILLSVFDTKRHSQLHRLFLLFFMIGVILSAIFTVMEYRWISKDYVYVRRLRNAYIAKAIIAGILFVLAVAFGIALFQATFVGGILEWIIAFGFTFYLLTFFYDLRLAKGNYKGKYTGASPRYETRSLDPLTVESAPHHKSTRRFD
jgi:hypothetical protein